MNPVSRIVCSSLFVVCLTLGAGLPRPADAQLLSTHYPEPSTNGAAHYNRALLAMSSIPLEERAILAKPIWEGFQGSSKEAIAQTIAKLTFTSRHALRAALNRAPGVVIYREWVDTVGLGYEVRQEQEAKVPAYAGSLDLAYARPAGGQG